MSAVELSTWIGRTGSVLHPSGLMRFSVIVTDAAMAWGKLRLFVKPVAGDGAAWIDVLSLSLDNPTEVRRG